MPEGEVRVISASSGTADGFRAGLLRAQAVLNMFRVVDLCFLTMVGWGHRGETVPAGRRNRKAISYEAFRIGGDGDVRSGGFNQAVADDDRAFFNQRAGQRQNPAVFDGSDTVQTFFGRQPHLGRDQKKKADKNTARFECFSEHKASLSG
jgi:hypothetical protein